MHNIWSGMRPSAWGPHHCKPQVRLSLTQIIHTVARFVTTALTGSSSRVCSRVCAWVPIRSPLFHSTSAGFPQLQDTVMLRMLLYPPTNALAFFPAAYQHPPAADEASNATVSLLTSLSIRNSSISTLCQTVADYTAFLSASSPTSVAVGLT